MEKQNTKTGFVIKRVGEYSVLSSPWESQNTHQHVKRVRRSSSVRTPVLTVRLVWISEDPEEKATFMAGTSLSHTLTILNALKKKTYRVQLKQNRTMEHSRDGA